jgi:ABC-2 type transport system permease protein
MRDAGANWIYQISALNPFTHAVESVRYALYGELSGSLLVVLAATLVFYWIAAAGYDPQRGLIKSARGG